jgi:hypothetical protein
MSMGEVSLHPLSKSDQIFPDKPPKNDGTLNKHSALLTQDPSRGGVQAYMYALGLTKEVGWPGLLFTPTIHLLPLAASVATR